MHEPEITAHARGPHVARESARRNKRVLTSWNEIAEYLGRGVRTVQRWERTNDLPVRRMGEGKRAPVYTTMEDLNFWMASNGISSNHQRTPAPAPVGNGHEKPIDHWHRLAANFHELAGRLAETTAQQHKQAELMHTRMTEIRSRMDARNKRKKT